MNENANLSTFRHFVFACYTWHSTSKFTRVKTKGKKSKALHKKVVYVWIQIVVAALCIQQGVEQIAMTKHGLFHSHDERWKPSQLFFILSCQTQLLEVTLWPSLSPASCSIITHPEESGLLLCARHVNVHAINPGDPPHNDRTDETGANKDKCLAAAAVAFI